MLPIETAGTVVGADGYDDVVVVRDLQVRTCCRCHRLPVRALVHIGYLPTGRLIPAGALAAAVDALGADEWVQPQAAGHVAEWVARVSGARGVGVVIEGRFTCAGTEERDGPGAMLTTTTRGALRDDPARRAEFLGALRRRASR